MNTLASGRRHALPLIPFNKLIFDTTDRPANSLIVAVRACTAIDKVQVAEKPVVVIELRRTPPEPGFANVEVLSTEAAEAPGSP